MTKGDQGKHSCGRPHSIPNSQNCSVKEIKNIYERRICYCRSVGRKAGDQPTQGVGVLVRLAKKFGEKRRVIHTINFIGKSLRIGRLSSDSLLEKTFCGFPSATS